ncbi:hypothetical protein LMG23992_01338 [Cupriavidus laharis]|uniref:Uncharacterized protein n=1 Tax=Cupriavidus laharis TaxID=151654 RepID=A0ABM8WNC4_9BURK|nr:hypothetical protein LMG23992_01338 [Cupriavidus laharis]
MADSATPRRRSASRYRQARGGVCPRKSVQWRAQVRAEGEGGVCKSTGDNWRTAAYCKQSSRWPRCQALATPECVAGSAWARLPSPCRACLANRVARAVLPGTRVVRASAGRLFPTRCRHPFHKDGEDRSQYFISHSQWGSVCCSPARSVTARRSSTWPPSFLFPHQWRKGDSYQQSFWPDEATDGLAPRLIPVPDQHPIPS